MTDDIPLFILFILERFQTKQHQALHLQIHSSILYKQNVRKVICHNPFAYLDTLHLALSFIAQYSYEILSISLKGISIYKENLDTEAVT